MATVLPFERQPLEAPLNDNAKRALHDLANRRVNDYGLHTRLTQVIERLDKEVGPLNDRVHEESLQHEKRLAKSAENGASSEDDEQRKKHDAFQRQVDELTKSMDKSIRQVIDTRVWLEELPNGLKHVNDTTSSAAQTTQRTTQRSSILPTQDQTPRPFNPDAVDEDPEMQDEDRPPPFDQTPSALLHAALSTHKMRWHAKTLTEKYAHDNDYTGFYANRFAAQNPGENPPPMPAAAIWFAAEEGRQASASQNAAGDDEDVDSDIEVAAERISIKCPITLLPFDDPLTNQKCKHSFEKTAILNMIRNSAVHKDLSAAQEAEVNAIRTIRDRNARRDQLQRAQPKGVKCPECRAFFMENDLKPNALLKRRVERELDVQRRREEAEQDQEEDDDDDDEDVLPRGTQRRPVGLESSPMGGTQRRRSAFQIKNEARMKQERASGRVPDSQQLPSGTQRTSQGAMVVDLDGESEDDLA